MTETTEPNTAETAALAAWLASDAGQRCAAALSRKIARQIQSGRLRLIHISPDDPELAAEIQSEFHLFVLSNNARLAVRFAGSGCSEALLLKQFIQHLQDANRSRGGSAYHYIYKRASDVLRNAGDQGFVTAAKAGGAGTAFSLGPAAHTLAALAREDLEKIAFPVHWVPAVTFDAVNRRRVLVQLAGYFWERIHEMVNMNVRVDLRDFINWLFVHMAPPDFSRPRQDPFDTNAPPEAQIPDSAGDPEKQYFDAAKVRQWAAMFTETLDAVDQKIFWLRHFQQTPLQKIAAKVPGLNSAAAVKYRCDQIEARLKAFVMLHDLPWLSPDDLNENAFDLFVETISAILKNRAAMP